MSHYSFNESIRSMADLRAQFPTGEADELNWCFLSTSGVHGTYTTLDRIEGPPEEDGYVYPHEITVLVVAPRMVRMNCGHIKIEPEDIPWLRRLVSSTLEAVARSQKGNIDA
jgi:hypothetical protein